MVVIITIIVVYTFKRRKLTKGAKEEEMFFKSLSDKEEVYYKTNEIKIDSQIGSGNFGAVFKGELADNQVALKKLLGNQIEDFKREAIVLKKLRHPNIVW